MQISPQAPVKIFGLPLEGFNMGTLFNTWVVMGILTLLCVWVARSPKKVPGRLQAGFEMFVEFFQDICNNTLGPQYGRKYMPFVGSIFLFVVLSNMIGIMPNLFFWAGWPGFEAPTQDLNTPLALGVLVLCVVHISAVRIRGFRGWLWSFFEPSFPAENQAARILGYIMLAAALMCNFLAQTAYWVMFRTGSTAFRLKGGALCAALAGLTVLMTVFSVKLKRIPNVPMAPLNFVGDLGKAISHPFRLYGNIFGGFVITLVLGELLWFIGIPPFLDMFFGLFIGVVQAFVFAMLALAYVAVAISE